MFTIYKRLREKTKKSIFKKYKKLWQAKFDNDYFNYISDFGTIVSLHGGYLLFLNYNNPNELDVKTNNQNIKNLQTFISQYHNKAITLPQMLTLIKNELKTFTFNN